MPTATAALRLRSVRAKTRRPPRPHVHSRAGTGEKHANRMPGAILERCRKIFSNVNKLTHKINRNRKNVFIVTGHDFLKKVWFIPITRQQVVCPAKTFFLSHTDILCYGWKTGHTFSSDFLQQECVTLKLSQCPGSASPPPSIPTLCPVWHLHEDQRFLLDMFAQFSLVSPAVCRRNGCVYAPVPFFCVHNWSLKLGGSLLCPKK